jgi:hypothetical protein
MVDQVHGLWTAQEWPVHESTMDLIVAGGQSSPELGLAAAPGHGRQKGIAGTLAVGTPWVERH